MPINLTLNAPSETLANSVSRTPIGLVPYDAAVPSTYTLATAQANSLAIADALVASRIDHKAIVLLAHWYCVADHDADGVDILIQDFDGLQFLSTGGLTDRLFPADQSTPGLSNNALVFVHIPDADITNDIIMEVRDCQVCTIGPVTFVGRRITSNAGTTKTANWIIGITDGNDPGGWYGQMALTGLLISNTDNSPDGRHRIIQSSNLVNEAARATSVGGLDGANFLTWDEFHTRYVWKGFKIDAVASQALQYLFVNQVHSGSPIPDCYFDIQGGGEIRVMQGYATPGKYLKINSTAGTQAMNFIVDNFIIDDEITSQSSQRILEFSDNGPSSARFRLYGRLGTSGASRQQILETQFVNASPLITNARNVIYDIHLGGVECEAYPTRPSAGWEVPLNPSRVSVAPAAETRLMIQAATIAEMSTWTKSRVGLEDRVSAIPDQSIAANNLIQTVGADTCPVSNYSNINHRPALNMRHGATATVRWMYRENADITDLNDVVGDITVMAVVVPGFSITGPGAVICCEGTAGTTGWALGIDVNENPVFTVQGISAALTTVNLASNIGRRYLLIGRRVGTEISITCNAETASVNTGPVGTLTATTNRLMLGARWTGSTTTNSFRGFIASVHVDLKKLFVLGSPTTGPLADNGDGTGQARLDYFRSGWGVW